MKFPVWVAAVESWWQGRPPRERDILRGGIAIFVILVSLSTWVWLREERVRLRHGVAAAELQVRDVQNELAEIQRLRTETPPPQLSAHALIAPLANSLRAGKIQLSVAAADGDRLRVQGVAGFDESINWLATIQRDHKVRILSLAATREASQAKLDAILGVASR